MNINIYDFKNTNNTYKLTITKTIIWDEIIKINPSKYKKDPFNQAKELYALLTKGIHLNDEDIENGYMLAFNKKGELLGIFHCTIGTEKHCVWNPEIDLIRLKLIGAKYFLLSHNHPHVWGKDIRQSSIDDRRMTELYIRIGKEYDYELLDHLLIGRDGYGSMRKSSSIFEEWRYE